MTERITLPPIWCSTICSNSMSDVCVEHCALKRDTSGFQVKPDLKLEDMPRFPQTEGMTREEKFTSVSIYLAKVVDCLQGVQNEHGSVIIRRPHTNSETSSRVSPTVQIQGVLHDLSEAITPLQGGEERQSENVRPHEVVGTDD